ncbi:hypothetical protein I4F81_000186 [Pyropia yezoensis]|uniref:Uncharacterized protein n=1 Tax=Pyropia yezoensis TaxID=2788 RepID=A0ACC3BIH7_PYRYE|nr:hypothetical protein I4F81_000186 [Neopyropia yezoensis]
MGAPATADARLSDGQALAVVAVDEPQTKVVLTTKPVIVPSPAAVKCILAVLNGLMDRSDAREVLYTLLRDTLLCFNRLHGGEADNCLPGEVEISTELAWTKVRTHLYRWWPIWRAPVGELAPFPVPGTVGFMSHPTRIGRVSRWALEVDMACVNETIKRLPVRSSILGGLPPVVSVTRIGPSVRSSLPLSVATLLLVASKEDRFFDVLTELATVGRAPAKKDCPIVVETCHDFETAELGALGETQPGDLSLPVRSEVRLAEDEDDAGELDEVADGLDVSAQESTPSQAAERERRYAEMDVLLAGEKESDAVATCAHRLAMRRLSRPVGAAVVSAEDIADDADVTVAPLPPPSSDLHEPLDQMTRLLLMRVVSTPWRTVAGLLQVQRTPQRRAAI